MASSSRQDDAAWSDFDNYRHSVKSNTVDRLKQIITGLAEENGVSISKSGKKQELIEKILNELDRYRYSRQVENWARARAVLNQVRTSGMYTSSGANQTFAANHNFSFSNAHGSAYVPPRPATNNFHAVNNIGSNSIGRFDPYAPPRRPHAPGISALSPVKSSPGVSVPIRFKASPFCRTEQAVSSVVECPESTGTMDRRSQTLIFSLSQEHINKLSMPSSRYQLRLYCTTNTFYSPSLSGFRSSTSLCPIEFPVTCEVRVNNAPLTANLKGIKKKPGTAPPADISKLARMAPGHQNRIEIIYVNSQQNTAPKKYYLIVFLVEATSVEQLVDRLRKGKFRSAEEIKAQMARSAVEDDDIVIGKQKMTLKCPLSYTRITIPSRSAKCVHSQCFDAVSWYSVMEQTTTWLCPVCEKTLNPEELIVDGYFESILQQTPESVEEVEVEPDGEWHTSDDKLGSKAWMDAHGHKNAETTLSVPKSKSNSQVRLSSSPQTKSDLANQSSALQTLGDVVVLDSDSENEDETRIKRELSPAYSSPISVNTTRNGSMAVQAKATSSAVIDLTLDSDDEEPAPAAPVSIPKRKAPEAPDVHEDVAQKKSRVDEVAIPMRGEEKLNNGYVNRSSSASSGPEVHSPFPGLTLPLPRQMSSSSVGSAHHHTPPAANSPPPFYYHQPHAPPIPPQNPRRFIPSPYSYQQPPATNGSGVPYNGADASRQDSTTYNPYLSRPNGAAGSRWP
ncbi:PLI1 [Sanghuangporus sanghuang]|uniref:Uncharacterized protein n=1 Tax=Sanghuangporus baumii TaxID=108892 RepID=A0A9Q5I656_SANBA|nr:hypothetical protein A7U60_g560 [Sanghuangporus baumii]